jgi:hypothetical protein
LQKFTRHPDRRISRIAKFRFYANQRYRAKLIAEEVYEWFARHPYELELPLQKEAGPWFGLTQAAMPKYWRDMVDILKKSKDKRIREAAENWKVRYRGASAYF